MTRIAILALAQERHGGTLLYTRSMIEALKRLAPERYQLALHTTPDNACYDDCGLALVRLQEPAQLLSSRWLRGIDPFEDADCVIAPIYSTILLATRKPFVFTLHDLQEKHYPEHFGLATRVWRDLTNRFLTARAARVICESRFVGNDIVTHFSIPASRIEVVPAPPIASLRESQLCAAEVVAVKAKLSLPEQYVFYPAQFWPHKNHLRLVEAFARIAPEFPRCRLVLTGKQRDEYERVFARVRELGLADRVKHLGYIESSELAVVYQCATVVTVPTLFESISIPVYEAFSIGTAVCVSNVVALPEQVGDAGLLFDPTSPEDIAAAIARLLRDPALRRTLAERGRQRMAAVTHASYAERLGSIVDAVIAPRETANA
ncbi:MAG: glycosyltransferase family 1 protein [Caldimonas sp.]